MKTYFRYPTCTIFLMLALLGCKDGLAPEKAEVTRPAASVKQNFEDKSGQLQNIKDHDESGTLSGDALVATSHQTIQNDSADQIIFPDGETLAHFLKSNLHNRHNQ